MNNSIHNINSEKILFHRFPLLKQGVNCVGYARLISQYGLSVPLP